MKFSWFRILPFVLILAGCAISNEGKVDFRRTSDLSKITAPPSAAGLQQLKAKNYSLGENSGFIAGDTVSLHLRSAYIKNFAENVVTPYITPLFTRNWREPVGEIAIVANAFEEAKGKELSFEDQENGRVVFYSDDVRKGQLINFNNMPIYGPLPYNGAPFAFRIAIFELDIASERIKAMLDSIAKAGGTAYPPASQVLNLLNGIGKTLLNGGQNDTEFRYTMVLDPKGGVKELNHFRLEAGNYALVRVENRNEDIPWDRLALNENEVKLYWTDNKDPATGKPVEYTDNTYVIVEVNKNISDVHVELAENNFSNLITALEKKDKQKADSWKSTNDAIMDIAIQKSQILSFSRAKEILEGLRSPDNSVSKAEKRVIAKELMTMVASSVTKEGEILEINAENKQGPILSDQQIKYVLKNIREIANGGLKEGLNEGNLDSLETKKIWEGFNKKTPEPGTQKAILDLIAPLPQPKNN